MPPKNPFTQPIGVVPAPAPTRSSKRILIISLIALAIIPVFCGGIAGVGYLAMKRIAQPSLQVNLPPRKDAFNQDAAEFNRSLERRVGSASDQQKQRVDRGLQRFIDNHIELLTQDDAVLPSAEFSPSSFIEAVATSEEGNGQINIAHRLTLADWIRTDAPQPDSLESQTHVLDVRLEADGKLAVVDLISYSDWNQAKSVQWFLVYEEQQWKFYDWQRLEYGRRISDEYASFIVGDTPQDQGYDKALVELARANTMWSDGQRDEAIELLRKTEGAIMLPSDRPVFRIRAAYTWMQFEKSTRRRGCSSPWKLQTRDGESGQHSRSAIGTCRTMMAHCAPPSGQLSKRRTIPTLNGFYPKHSVNSNATTKPPNRLSERFAFAPMTPPF
ncbi:hypothetical protein RSSM_03395 [Rhodopirellula sallentina SM41]|uniref:Uncharacterized protein n=1 Tax=Rhodopirellula sallentina SM41 TaxID=1263870 RepID=M5UBD6_9BACT|nr:hypothetical protein RSSM_03395 [Rhodopirellula sallentina SM41]